MTPIASLKSTIEIERLSFVFLACLVFPSPSPFPHLPPPKKRKSWSLLIPAFGPLVLFFLTYLMTQVEFFFNSKSTSPYCCRQFFVSDSKNKQTKKLPQALDGICNVFSSTLAHCLGDFHSRVVELNTHQKSLDQQLTLMNSVWCFFEGLYAREHVGFLPSLSEELWA